MVTDYDVIIIGGGPAGLTAGLYTRRAKLRTLLLEKENPGGQIANIEWIENYPGFADGISGAELGLAMMSQAMKYGLEFKLGEVVGIDPRETYRVVKTTQDSYLAKVVIISGGAHPKKLGVPGEEVFAGHGVIYCAVCDGGQFANRVVATAGGGDAGVTEALYLTRLASKVILIEAMPQLTAAPVLQEKAFANPKLEIRCGTKIEAIVGNSQVKALGLLDIEKNERSVLNVGGILVHVGIQPNTEYLKDIIPLDGEGQILVDDKMETGVPGIFAAGDIRHGSAKQIIAAAGDGATAALAASRFLER